MKLIQDSINLISLFDADARVFEGEPITPPNQVIFPMVKERQLNNQVDMREAVYKPLTGKH